MTPAGVHGTKRGARHQAEVLRVEAVHLRRIGSGGVARGIVFAT